MTDRFYFGAALAVAMIATSAIAQSNDPAWLDDLQDQMQRDEGCLVDLFINIDEGVLAVGAAYFAQVAHDAAAGKEFSQ